MKAILIIAIITMLTTGFAAAIDMSDYDIDENGVIDATERVTLDIDIENARLTRSESMVIDSYSVDDTIILTPEFQAAFLNPEVHVRETVTEVVIVEDPAPVVEETAVPTPTAEPVIVTAPMDDDLGGNSTFVLIVLITALVGLIIYIYSRKPEE